MNDVTLLERLKRIQIDRKDIVSLKVGEKETRELRASEVELSKLVTELYEAKKILAFMKEQELLVVDINQKAVKNAEEKIAELDRKFEKAPKRSTLVEGNGWPQLVDAINQLEGEIQNATKRSWSAFKKDIFKGHSPEILDASIVHTEQNNIILSQYKEAHRKLVMAFEKDDYQNLESIKTLKIQSKTLQELAKKLMDYKAPDSVKAFLKAISQNGAQLELLTEEVIKWLKDHRVYNKYVITGKS